MKKRYNKRYWLCFGGLLAGLYTVAQVKDKVPAFEIINKVTTAAGGKAGRLGLSAGNNNVTFRMEHQQGKPVYHVQTNGTPVKIPALTDILYVKKADRILVYGDSTYTHTLTDVYANLYAGNGTLIKSLGKLAVRPFTVTLSDKGSLAIAGNRGDDKTKLSMFLSLYDPAGNKLWQTDVPAAIPTGVFVSPDNRYTALVLYSQEKGSSSIRYYNGSGGLLFTEDRHRSVAAVEFLPSGKAVVCAGDNWYVYDVAAGNKLLHSGTLPGKAAGKYPVAAHPSKDIFFIVSTHAAGYSVQGFDGLTGTMLAQSVFEGQLSWQPYRMAEAGDDGTVRVVTEKEILTLRMK